jgi:magnesium transporter
MERSQQRQEATLRSRKFMEERLAQLRARLGLRSNQRPLPGEAAFEDSEIGRAPGQLPAASPFESQGPTRFRAICYDEASVRTTEFTDLDSVGKLVGQPGLVWIQVLGITDPQIVHVVGAFFDVPMLAQEDVLTAASRPKFEQYGDQVLAIARAVRVGVTEDTPRGQQISLVAGPGFLLSFHETDDPVFAAVERRIAENKGGIRKWGPGYLLYALLDTLVDRLLVQTEEIEDALIDLEEEALGEGRGLNLDEVYRLKRVIVRLSRLALPLKDMVSVLEHYEHGLLPPTMDMFFRDLYDHAIRAGDRIEHARTILQELQEYHHTLQERKTSEIVRVLTVMSSIFIPLTFVVGIYGMNFRHMPELESPWGYYAVLGAMAAFTVGMLFWFRRRRWL